MRAPLSVIIPTLNAADVLPACLASLVEGLEAGILREVVVCDGGSVDATVLIAQEAGANVVTSAPSRGGQSAAGAKASGGDWMLFLHADTVLDAGWSKTVLAHFAMSKAGYFRLVFDAKGFAPWFVAGWANLRSRVFGLPYGDQGLLISRALYQEVGGYRDMPLMEDVAMARALRGRLVALEASAKTSAAKYEKSGWIVRGSRNLTALTRYFCGVDPALIAQSYRR